jgi:hypothetical protein
MFAAMAAEALLAFSAASSRSRGLSSVLLSLLSPPLLPSLLSPKSVSA